MVNATPQPLYPPCKRLGTHCIGGWVGPRAGLDGCAKPHPPSGFDPQTIQPIASCYTDWATRAQQYTYCILLYLYKYTKNKQKLFHTSFNYQKCICSTLKLHIKAVKLTVTRLKELHQFLHFVCKMFYLAGMLQNCVSAKHYQLSQNYCNVLNGNSSPCLSFSNCHCCTYLCMNVLIKQKLS